MSRIGKAPIEIPAGVTVDVAKDNVVTVKGPKGTLSQAVNPEFTITIEDGHLHIARPTDDREHRAQHGLFRALIQGYLSTAGGFLTPEEKRLLPFSGRLLTFECGLRFLTDFLEGDVYFRTHREGQNLDRCRTQFHLVAQMEAKEAEMNAFVQ